MLVHSKLQQILLGLHNLLDFVPEHWHSLGHDFTLGVGVEEVGFYKANANFAPSLELDFLHTKYVKRSIFIFGSYHSNVPV
jgi:hypothetical protein